MHMSAANLFACADFRVAFSPESRALAALRVSSLAASILVAMSARMNEID